MESKNWQKFPMLFCLYIAQSIPMSFFSTVVPVIMRQEKYSLESIGLIQLVKLPWIFKFLWAPLVDNHTNSSRQIKTWIIVSEIFYAAIIISIGFFELQYSFKLIVILMVIAFIASATQDIATDIYAILVLKEKERSIGNSMQSAGSFIGSLFGTGVLLLAYHYFGWQNLLVLLASFVAFAIIPLLLYKPGTKVVKEHKKRITLKDIFSFFNNKVTAKRLLLLMFYYSGLIGTLAMMKPYMVDLGYNVKQIGFMSGIIGTAVAAGFAFSGGFIVKTLGCKISVYVFAIINLCAALYMYFISLNTPAMFELYIGICMIWGAYGLSTVIIYTTSMDLVRKGSEGTDFTVQIVITHLSGLLIAVFSGKIGDLLGYSGVFGIESLLCIAAIAFVFLNYPIKRSELKNETR